MRNRVIGSILAVAAALAISPSLLAQRASSPPDLSGVWMLRDVGNNTFTKEAIPMRPSAEEKFKASVAAGPSKDPEMNCFPPGMPRIYFHRYPIEIVQQPGRVLMIFEFDHFIRQIWTDGRKHPAEEELDHTWMGHSVGRWDGDTLVVDTVGLNDKTWLDSAGHPHSDALHVVERIRRVNPDTLEIEFTFDDPKTYTKPWKGQKLFRLRPGWEIAEQVCADNFLWKEPGK